MVRIRLKRLGAKKRPFYRIVVADQRCARDGRFIEAIGFFDPTTDPSTIKVDTQKAEIWIGKGAQPTDTVRAILKKAGMFGGYPAPAIGEVVEKKGKGKKANATVVEAAPVVEPVAETVAEPVVEAVAEVAAEAIVEAVAEPEAEVVVETKEEPADKSSE